MSSCIVVLGLATWSRSEIFAHLTAANLTINLAKYEFGKARVVYFEKVVGGGQVRLLEAKIEAIYDFPVPGYHRELLAWLSSTHASVRTLPL